MKIALSVATTIVALGLMAGGVYYFTHPPVPMTKSDEELKPIVADVATQFILCIEARKLGPCYDNLTTAEYKAATNLEQMNNISNTIREKLGDRISGALDADSVVFQTTSDKVPVKFAQFTMSAIYQNDAITKEKFILIYDSTADRYRVQTFKINSSKF